MTLQKKLVSVINKKTLRNFKTLYIVKETYKTSQYEVQNLCHIRKN